MPLEPGISRMFPQNTFGRFFLDRARWCRNFLWEWTFPFHSLLLLLRAKVGGGIYGYMQSRNPWQIEIDHKHREASPQDHFVGGHCHHPPISPDIRPSENQSLWFGDKYLSSDYLVTTSLARVCTGALGRRVVLLRQHLAPSSARPSVAVRRSSSEHPCVSSLQCAGEL